MRSSDQLLIATAVAICLLTLVSGGQSYAETEQTTLGGDQNEHASFKLPKLFDFGYFKERFGKKYATLSEELARKTYFVARAFRAFVSGMNFKWRRSGYYLAVNHMSDASPQERAARKNKRLAELSREQQQLNATQSAVAQETQAKDEDELPEFLPAAGENYEQEIQELLEKHRDEPGYRELLQESHSRKKRSVDDDDARALGPRDFSLDKLIKPGVHQVAPEAPEVRAKITSDVASNNPNYRQPELLSEGLNHDHVELHEWPIEPKRDPRSLDKQLDFSLSGLASRMYLSLPKLGKLGKKEVKGEVEKKSPEQTEAGDVVYFDHRDSHCFTRPRDQGECGACYAFASMALMEWLYCTKRGVLVPFSEQYMIDCGNWRFGRKMQGCNGAADSAVFKFIQNFGVERQKTYPYRERERECPYDDDIDLEAAGYIRIELADYATVPVSRWAEYIEHGPLYMSIASPDDYEDYSGGVHDGQNCADFADHAQLLVGHGREDGQDYWLIRNSYGANWGEDGYFKLSKNAPERCIEEQRGFALGTRDARRYSVEPRENRRYKELVEKKTKKAKKVRGLHPSNLRINH